jgi:hypothetical protein
MKLRDIYILYISLSACHCVANGAAARRAALQPHSAGAAPEALRTTSYSTVHDAASFGGVQ